MALNIKDEETHRLVRDLANLTGENMTVAVRESVRERRLLRLCPGKVASEPLLFVGEDFARTDITPATGAGSE
jgi:hypothetical protein